MVCPRRNSTTGSCLISAGTAPASTPWTTLYPGSVALGCVVPPASSCGTAARLDCSRSHVHATVDAPHLSGDVGGGVGGQEVDHSRDFLGPAGAADRDLAGDFGHHLLRKAGG